MQKGIDKVKNNLEPKAINIFERRKLEVIGVKEIVSSTDTEIYIKLSESLMQISGETLVIVKLVPEDMLLVVEGRIDGVNFISRMTKKSLFKKVFK